MLSRVRLLTKNRYVKNCRFLSDSSGENPLDRTFRLLGNDMKKVKNFFRPQIIDPQNVKPDEGFSGETNQTGNDGFQTHCDVLVIGGGGVGSSIAYWLKQRARNGLNVVVVEKDSTVSFSYL